MGEPNTSKTKLCLQKAHTCEMLSYLVAILFRQKKLILMIKVYKILACTSGGPLC